MGRNRLNWLDIMIAAFAGICIVAIASCSESEPNPAPVPLATPAPVPLATPQLPTYETSRMAYGNREAKIVQSAQDRDICQNNAATLNAEWPFGMSVHIERIGTAECTGWILVFSEDRSKKTWIRREYVSDPVPNPTSQPPTLNPYACSGSNRSDGRYACMDGHRYRCNSTGLIAEYAQRHGLTYAQVVDAIVLCVEAMQRNANSR